MSAPIISLWEFPWDNTKGRRREMGVCVCGGGGIRQVETFKKMGGEN